MRGRRRKREKKEISERNSVISSPYLCSSENYKSTELEFELASSR
jgi:hypothetical protein